MSTIRGNGSKIVHTETLGMRVLAKGYVIRKVELIIGGTPVSREWAEEIETEAYAESAMEAVQVVKRPVQA